MRASTKQAPPSESKAEELPSLNGTDVTDNATQANGRIEAFDSLRGMAALGVVLWHYGEHFGAHPLSGLFAPFYNAGYLLVDFFFVLSGYVIARAYWTDNRRKLFVKNVRARIARLYPLHFFTLLLVEALQYARIAQGKPPFVYELNDAYNFVLNVLMLNGTGLQSGFSFNGPAWSISTEFVVNVAFLIFIGSGILLRGLYFTIAGAGALVLFLTSGTLLKYNLIFGYLDLQLSRLRSGLTVSRLGYRFVHLFFLAKFRTRSISYISLCNSCSSCWMPNSISRLTMPTR